MYFAGDCSKINSIVEYIRKMGGGGGAGVDPFNNKKYISKGDPSLTHGPHDKNCTVVLIYSSSSSYNVVICID
jgi:hypothetical protein